MRLCPFPFHLNNIAVVNSSAKNEGNGKRNWYQVLDSNQKRTQCIYQELNKDHSLFKWKGHIMEYDLLARNKQGLFTQMH